MRTLVVSDLHLGARHGRDILQDPDRRRALATVVAGADRLVLLGDVLELRQGPLREAIAAAREPLCALGEALDPAAPVVVVAGNHDHRLVEPWLARRPPEPALGVAAAVTVADGEPLAALAGWLGARRTSVAYPGVWLRDDVWATHGHYLDRHTTVPMLERIAAGVMARIVGETGDATRPRRAEDYEAVLAPIYAWLDALAQGGGSAAGRSAGPGAAGASAGAWRVLTGRGEGGARGGRGLRRRAAAAAFPALIAALNRARIGPLSADLSSAGLRSGALGAIGEVTRRLDVHAAHVVFGHTHRAGPLPADDSAQWWAPSGARLINCGCWVRETTFLGADPSRSPYRAGFAVWVDSDPARSPELVNLLDG